MVILGIEITGQPRYVKLAYLEYTAYVEVIIHSRAFPHILLCISNLFMSNWVITKSRLYRSGFSFLKGTVSGSGTGPLDYGATGPVPDTEPRL